MDPSHHSSSSVGASAKTNNRDNNNVDGNGAAYGFTGFSEAQLTHLRRFYNDAAPTGSERKPINVGDDDAKDDRNDDASPPTASGQSPFAASASTQSDMNKREY